jgi:hypothetical protein
MQFSFSGEVGSSAAIQEILNILRNQKVYYHVQNTLHWSLSWAKSIQSMPRILSLQDPSQYYPPAYTLIILVVSCLLAFQQVSYMQSSLQLVLHALLTHPPWLIVLILLSKEHVLWSSSLRNFLQPPVTSSHSGPNIFHGILFSNTLSLRI